MHINIIYVNRQAIKSPMWLFKCICIHKNWQKMCCMSDARLQSVCVGLYVLSNVKRISIM